VDNKEFEKKFENGEYITPSRFEEILESYMEAIENNSNLCGMTSPHTERKIRKEEYLWLSENHPECLRFYTIK
jgi:hypothetical protein